MSGRAGRRGKHRSKPRRFTSARVHGQLCTYCRNHKARRYTRRAPTRKDWPDDR